MTVVASLRSLVCVTGALLAVLLPGAQPAWAGPPPYEVARWPPPADDGWPSVGRAAGVAAEVVAGVNRRRVAAGCRPVRLRSSLGRAARAHSADMARHERLDHTGTDGSGPQERMRAAGYRAAYAGEAIAAGADSARAVVGEWMDSPSHRDLILTCRFTHAGVGRAEGPGGPWWTLDLASKH
ncbi:CAP domain-containing protein [Streptomyces sp. NPDC102406]|uniref:CAP domain-containing protein n=1 Tax=Streptomyces sp. NPDC102406 TaxID=3366171 RepID=UPI0037FACED6